MKHHIQNKKEMQEFRRRLRQHRQGTSTASPFTVRSLDPEVQPRRAPLFRSVRRVKKLQTRKRASNAAAGARRKSNEPQFQKLNYDIYYEVSRLASHHFDLWILSRVSDLQYAVLIPSILLDRRSCEPTLVKARLDSY